MSSAAPPCPTGPRSSVRPGGCCPATPVAGSTACANPSLAQPAARRRHHRRRDDHRQGQPPPRGQCRDQHAGGAFVERQPLTNAKVETPISAASSAGATRLTAASRRAPPARSSSGGATARNRNDPNARTPIASHSVTARPRGSRACRRAARGLRRRQPPRGRSECQVARTGSSRPRQRSRRRRR